MPCQPCSLAQAHLGLGRRGPALNVHVPRAVLAFSLHNTLDSRNYSIRHATVNTQAHWIDLTSEGGGDIIGDAQVLAPRKPCMPGGRDGEAMTAPNTWEAVRLAFLDWLKERQPLDAFIMRHADAPTNPTEVWILFERSQQAEAKFATSLATLLGPDTQTED